MVQFSSNKNGNKLEVCNNCNCSFIGKYCSNCGQSVNNSDGTLRNLLTETLSNAFAFDTKLTRTLYSVFFRPGKMETEYAQGKRVKYMPPFKTYFFMSIGFFFLINYMVSNYIKTATLEEETTRNITNTKINSENDSQSFIKDIDESKMSQKKGSAAVKFRYTESGILIEDNSKIAHALAGTSFKIISWLIIILLIPIYGILLQFFFKKTQPFFIANFILSVNHHIYMLFFLLSGALLLYISKSLIILFLLYIFAGLFIFYIFYSSYSFFRCRWHIVLIRLLLIWLIHSILIVLIIFISILLAIIFNKDLIA